MYALRLPRAGCPGPPALLVFSQHLGTLSGLALSPGYSSSVLGLHSPLPSSVFLPQPCLALCKESKDLRSISARSWCLSLLIVGSLTFAWLPFFWLNLWYLCCFICSCYGFCRLESCWREFSGHSTLLRFSVHLFCWPASPLEKAHSIKTGTTFVYLLPYSQSLGFPGGSVGKESACNAGFDPWVGKIP